MTELHYPGTTLLAGALLGLIFAVLSILVVVQRGAYKVNLGSGETPAAASDPAASPLLVAVRSQANFAEYVPLILILLALVEMRTGSGWKLQALAYGLVVARVAHPIGMRLKAPNPFRAAGFLLTIIILIGAAVQALRVVLM